MTSGYVTTSGPRKTEGVLERGEKLIESDPVAAAASAREVLQTEPRSAAACRLLAKALERQGKVAEANAAKEDAVRLSRFVPAVVEAHKANLSGRAQDVEAMLAQHLARYPDDPVALMIRGEAFNRIGRLNEAVRDLEAALAFMPEYREAGLALMRAHQRRFDNPAALAVVETLIEAKPGDVWLMRWKAALLSNLGENEAAAEILAGLTRTGTAPVEVWISLGDELRTLGRAAEAHAAYSRALEIEPTLGTAWWSIAAVGHAPLDEAERARIQDALAVSTDPDRRYYLHFALGTAFDRAGMHREAFENFAAGNAIRHARDPFDPAVTDGEVERTRRNMTPAFFAEREGAGHPSSEPIFIVSLPRAGSTLVEQVLASHPEIEGTAELPFVPVLIRTLAAEHGIDIDSSYRDLLRRLDPEIFAAIGEEYLRLARPHRKQGKPHFLDKLPHNWADVGFIKLILPNAKVIDVRRSPMDCCWSNFRLLFATGHPASNSLEGIAAYYRSYVAMMAHFDEVQPGHVHHVIYEHLVESFEPEVRRMLDYLGLPFDPAVLGFHATERSVATASAQQVRRPLNRQGIGAWRAYEPWLGPLKEALGDLEETYAGTA